MAYTYTVRGIPTHAPMGDPQYATRHEAVGEAAILEAIHPGSDLEITARTRWATDPV